MTGKSTEGKLFINNINVQRSLILLAVAACTGCALSIPFLYESQTMWYKIGIDRTLLRLGKMAGLLTVVLLAVQVIAGTRGAFLERAFGVVAVMAFHRVNGMVILLLAISHVGLVLLPEGLDNLPLGWKYWPEMIGASVLLLIGIQTLIAQLRQSMKFNYLRWRNSHRVIGYLILSSIVSHILFVSDSFTHPVPRYGLLTFLGLLFVFVLSIKFSQKRWKK